VELASDPRLRVALSRCSGLGLWAATDVAADCFLAWGFPDYDVTDSASPVASRDTRAGALYGPSSLVNAGCGRCSNVRFKVGKLGDAPVWRLMASRSIKAGQELLAGYSCLGVTGCLVCDTHIAVRK
jgi:hypothetical protein